MNQSKQKSEAETLKGITREIVSPRFLWGVDDLKETKRPPKESKA